MFENLVEKLKKDRKSIVFTEGMDPRILEAASRLKKEDFLTMYLVGKVDDVKALAAEKGFDIDGIEIIDPATYPEMDGMVEEMTALRKGKMTEDECREALQHGNYFGTMLVHQGKVDCLLGGATYSTADTIRPALQIVKTKPENKIVSSTMMMIKSDDEGNVENMAAFADCAINIDPTAEQLCEIAIESAETAKRFGMTPRVAMLSYSTHGSGAGPDVDKVVEATKLVKERAPELIVDGEIQFDAAFAPPVYKKKAKGSPLEGKANVFIFPEINSSNAGCKICQWMGGYDGYGPVLQGLNAPLNDLSRGCNPDEIYAMAIITAAQATVD